MIGKYWLTQEETVPITGAEHIQFAMAQMLELGRKYAPAPWRVRGIPADELEAALARGVDPRAVRFLENPKNDAREYVIREYGWVRVHDDRFNVWDFNEQIGDLLRARTEFWQQQAYSGADLDHDFIMVEESKTGNMFKISIKKLLDGGNPEILKRLAQAASAPEQVRPQQVFRAAGGFTELERKRLARMTGDNPGPRYEQEEQEEQEEQANMSVYPADVGARIIKIPGHPAVRFVPTGPVYTVGNLGFSTEAKNPGNRARGRENFEREERPTQGARFFLGFNIGKTPVWNMKEVTAWFHRERREQVEIAFKEGYATPSKHGGDIGASFIQQSGLWQEVQDPDAHPEDSAQIICFNTISEDPQEFRDDMEYLAQEMAIQFKQFVVLLEHQERGVVVETVLVTPEK